MQTNMPPRFQEARTERPEETSRWERYAALEDRRDVVWSQIAKLLKQRTALTPREFDDRYDQLERESDDLWRQMCKLDDASFEEE